MGLDQSVGFSLGRQAARQTGWQGADRGKAAYPAWSHQCPDQSGCLSVCTLPFHGAAMARAKRLETESPVMAGGQGLREIGTDARGDQG